jgi:sec-independent protein translocase protein TatC
MTFLTYLETFAPHYQELRTRLVRSFAAIIIATAAAYFFKDQIAAFCMEPLFSAHPDLERLVYTKLTEAFIAYIKLALVVGLLISFPYVLYQIWMFVSPGLLTGEQRTVRWIMIWGTLLFFSGAGFAFFIALPRVLLFFMSYAGENLEPMPKLGLYLTFVVRMSFSFGLAFQIPFIMVMAGRTGLVDPNHFQKKRIWFYAAIVVLAFLLAAGDITATVLLALPLFGLYEAGILVGRLFQVKKEKEEQKDSDQDLSV